MKKDVYIGQCPVCKSDVYGMMTSSFADTMTILFECHQCGEVWTVDRTIGLAEEQQETPDSETAAG